MHLKEFQKYHCLIVDREMFMRRVLRQMLRQLGVAEVEEAKDGAHAFSICAHTTFHIVVTELLMPVMGGVELTAQIRRGKGVDNQIPIIGYTADITPELLRSARDAGINELMTRPFSSGVLIKKMGLALHTVRPFVRCPTYVGPCRRRKALVPYIGLRRRQDDAVAAKPEKCQPQNVPGVASQDALTNKLTGSRSF